MVGWAVWRTAPLRAHGCVCALALTGVWRGYTRGSRGSTGVSSRTIWGSERRCSPSHCCGLNALPPSTSAPGLGSPLPHLHCDWAHPCHVCAGTGLTPATSAPGLGFAGPLPAPSARALARSCAPPSLCFATEQLRAHHLCDALSQVMTAGLTTATAASGAREHVPMVLKAAIVCPTSLVGTPAAFDSDRAARCATRHI